MSMVNTTIVLRIEGLSTEEDLMPRVHSYLSELQRGDPRFVSLTCEYNLDRFEIELIAQCPIFDLYHIFSTCEEDTDVWAALMHSKSP